MISKEEVEYVAQLARIQINENEKPASPAGREKFVQDLSTILDYVAELDAAPTENIEEISQISGLSNIVREDQIVPSLPVEKVLANAPEKEGNFIKVKKVFE